MSAMAMSISDMRPAVLRSSSWKMRDPPAAPVVGDARRTEKSHVTKSDYMVCQVDETDNTFIGALRIVTR
jgi:hypothetical protein